MVRIRGSGHNGGSGRGRPNDGYSRHLENRAASTLVEAKAYPCTTKYEETSLHLAVRGIQLPNFAYEFSTVEGVKRLSDTDDGFLLPLHALEASFHLPLHPFFYHLFEEYGIALGQLSGFSWWDAISYYIDCYHRYKEPLLFVFQNLYQLKAYN